MQVKFLMQNGKEGSLINSLIDSFSKKPKKVYMFLGDLKEAGFRLIEEEFIDTKIKLFMAIGVNKKHTTRSMLESILEYTKDAYYYTNNDIVEYDSNICIFEYTNEVEVYVSPSSFSESGISENISLYTKIMYNLKDTIEKNDYKATIKDLTKNLEELNFVKLDKEAIEKLIEDKEIFTTRQYTHTNIKSISELLGKTKEDIETDKKIAENAVNDIIGSDVEIPKIDLSNSDIDIDIQDIEIPEEHNTVNVDNAEHADKKSDNDIDVEYDEEDNIPDNVNLEEYEEDFEDKNVIDKNNELYDESMADMEFDQDSVLDINDMLFSKADVKLDEDVKNRKKEEPKEKYDEFSDEEVLQVKKVNLNNVSNLIMELPSKNSKGQDANSIKVPNYVQKMIPEFFEIQDGANVEINGISYKQRDIKLEIIDVKSGEKYTDRDAKISQRKGQSFLLFSSDIIKNINYDEKDIARVIKLASDTYHIEIIPKNIQEYKLWDKLCTYAFKSSTRKYGMM